MIISALEKLKAGASVMGFSGKGIRRDTVGFWRAPLGSVHGEGKGAARGHSLRLLEHEPKAGEVFERLLF